jgi:5-methylcytosine-specific restriction endonuclease McrA
LKNHTKVYLKFFGYTGYEFMPCECCGGKAVDVHHIRARGMGGSKLRDVIENLMGLCRVCHEKYGDKEQWREWLVEVHERFMVNGLKFTV